MVTFVGFHGKFPNVLRDLLELEYEALDAYNTAIDRLAYEDYKNKIEEFKQDHKQHIEKLEKLVVHYGLDIPKGPFLKSWLTSGKVIIGNLTGGDESILKAILSNELDTNEAYKRFNEFETMGIDKSHNDLRDFLINGYKDEKRHKAWLEGVISDQRSNILT